MTSSPARRALVALLAIVGSLMLGAVLEWVLRMQPLRPGSDDDIDALLTSTPERTIYFRSTPIATYRQHDGADFVRRTSFRGETFLLTLQLDDDGCVRSGRSVRTGRRIVELAHGTLTTRTPGVGDPEGSAAGASWSTPIAGCVVVLEALPFVRASADGIACTFLDLGTAERQAGRVVRQGPEIIALDDKDGEIARARADGTRIGPGAFVEDDAPPHAADAPVEPPIGAPRFVGRWALDGISSAAHVLDVDGPGAQRQAPTPDASIVVSFDASHVHTPSPDAHDRGAEAFVEVDAPAVRAFAQAHGAAVDALADARTIAEAVHALVNADAVDEPPSALAMLERGGDCDGAAVLTTAALRALGHAARPVVGYRVVEEGGGARLVPHAWTEVYTKGSWLMVDATIPALGTLPTHLRLFRGVGGALTMGRVLGRLSPRRL